MTKEYKRLPNQGLLDFEILRSPVCENIHVFTLFQTCRWFCHPRTQRSHIPSCSQVVLFCEISNKLFLFCKIFLCQNRDRTRYSQQTHTHTHTHTHRERERERERVRLLHSKGLSMRKFILVEDDNNNLLVSAYHKICLILRILLLFIQERPKPWILPIVKGLGSAKKA